MKLVISMALLIAFTLLAGPALADIPTNDAAQLTQHSEMAGATVKLVPITAQRQDANSGVKCAVTTGKKASVTNPTVQPQSEAGSQAIQKYAPDMPAAPIPGAQGAALNSQTFFKSTGDVVAGLDASRSTLGAAQFAFKTATTQVGTTTTVMAAIDMNSATRLQNNLAWNGAIGSANIWVTALNALNLALNSNLSRAAIGMRSTVNPAGNPVSPACPSGMVGSATAGDPCRAALVCSTTPPGTPADPACLNARYLDTNENVHSYLATAQSMAQATSGAGVAGAPSSSAEVASALATIRSNTQ